MLQIEHFAEFACATRNAKEIVTDESKPRCTTHVQHVWHGCHVITCRVSQPCSVTVTEATAMGHKLFLYSANEQLSS